MSTVFSVESTYAGMHFQLSLCTTRELAERHKAYFEGRPYRYERVWITEKALDTILVSGD